MQRRVSLLLQTPQRLLRLGSALYYISESFCRCCWSLEEATFQMYMQLCHLCLRSSLCAAVLCHLPSLE